MNIENFGSRVLVSCPKCGYNYDLALKALAVNAENTHRCHICKKYFSFDIIFFAEGANEKQQAN